MINSIKAEFLKIFTIRSTYILLGLTLLLELIFAFWVNGYKVSPQTIQNPNFLADQISGAILATAMLGALVGILLMTHEYRYNTIMFTLTSSNSRTKTLLAKIVAVTVFSLLFTVVAGALSPLLAYLGASLKGLEFGPQTIPYADLVWRALFFGWAYSQFALMLASIIRNQVGAIIAIFLVPGIVEQLLSLVLKSNAKYLPFNSLSAVLSQGGVSHAKGAVIFGLYLIVGWLIAWVLFLRRDAN